MTAQERVSALHARMDTLKRAREKRKTALIGTGCGVLAACLLLLVFGGAGQRGGTAGAYSGATMLFDNAGGYVLVALCAFAAGATITLMCVKRKKSASGKNFGTADKTDISDISERRESK